MIWQVIAGCLVAFILVITVLLMFPVTVATESTRSARKISGIFCITWLMIRLRYILQDKRTEFLLFGRTLLSLQSKAKVQERESAEKPLKPPKPPKPAKTGKRPPAKQVIKVVKPLLKLCRELLATVQFRHLAIDTTYGLEDPAHTGFLTGFLHILRGTSPVGENFHFTPDFSRSILEWDISVSASIVPIRIFPPIARFFADRQVLRSGWAIIRS